jgi:hypothetical protein
MRRALGPFFRGVVARLTLGVSAVLSIIGVVDVVRGAGGNPWMWFFLGALGLLGSAYVAYANLHREHEHLVNQHRDKKLADELLYRKCVVIGGGIEMFVRERADLIPKLSPPKQVELAEGTLPKAEEFDYRMALIDHEHETEWQYKERFVADVFRVVAALRERGRVPEPDMEWLNYPTDLDDISRIGDRLSEIGRRVKPAEFASRPPQD